MTTSGEVCQPTVAATAATVCVFSMCVQCLQLLQQQLRHSILIRLVVEARPVLKGAGYAVQYSDWITWSPSYGGGKSSTPRVLMPLLSKYGPCLRWPAIRSHGPLPWSSAVKISAAATSSITPKCVAKATSSLMMRWGAPLVHLMMQRIMPVSILIIGDGGLS